MSTPPSNSTPLDLSTLTSEERIQLAIQAVKASGVTNGGVYRLSLRQAAKDYNVARTTLTNRFNGVPTKREAHTSQRKLTDAQEDVLVEWIKEMGYRGMPMTPSTLIDYVQDITGDKVGQSWVHRFMSRHPELKVKWTTSLEESRARSLNPAVVAEFYQLLGDVIDKYNIPVENIYNVDEKGIQLGVGKRVAALVDRNQKTVNQVEDGNREMITIIEAVSADGTVIIPSVIYQGKRRDLEWGRQNPCQASLSHSPNGWTDQELGSKWLENDFHPASQARNVTNGYRLLILDGHNSHCTYKFCKFAEDNRIIVICLPSHTTHALQPCDVGVFGPLASHWKSIVVKCSNANIPISKRNFLVHYSAARNAAFKPSTIISAFAKTGIWPLNPNAIDPKLFAPSQNTTTKSSQPISASLPPMLIPNDTPLSTTTSTAISHGLPPSLSHMPQPTGNNHVSPSLSHLSQPTTATPSAISVTSASTGISAAGTISSAPTVTVAPATYRIAMPPPPPPNASIRQLWEHVQLIRQSYLEAGIQLERNYTQLVLMDKENARLRHRAYYKEQKKGKKKQTNTHPRHMTAEDCLDALARYEWEAAMKIVFRDMTPLLKAQQKKIKDHMDELAAEARRLARLDKEKERNEKREKAAAEKKRLSEERAAERARRDLEKVHDKSLELMLRAQAAAERRELAARKKADAAAKKKADAEAKRAAAVARKAAAAALASSPRKHKGKGGKKPAEFPLSEDDNESDNLDLPLLPIQLEIPSSPHQDTAPVRRNPTRTSRR